MRHRDPLCHPGRLRRPERWLLSNCVANFYLRLMSPKRGGVYRTASRVLARAELSHLSDLKPATPESVTNTIQINGKAERFILSAVRTWAYAHPYQNSQQRANAMKSWLHNYNGSSAPHPSPESISMDTTS